MVANMIKWTKTMLQYIEIMLFYQRPKNNNKMLFKLDFA